MNRIIMFCIVAFVALGVGACSGDDSNIIVQKDGLSIEDIKVGDGAVAVPGKKLTIDYIGWYWKDGKKHKFESTYDSGKPLTFTLGRGEVIRGWDRGLRGMKVGGKRWLGVPKHLGYGTQSAEKGIPQNAVLWFDIELLKVE